MRMKSSLIGVLTIIGTVFPAQVAAQEQESAANLAVMDLDSLRGEIQMRFDAALAATRDGGVVAADDPRYVWASEAKAQCAIALGFLKSSTRDATSISKCDYAYRLMTVVPRKPVAPPPPAPPPPPPPPRPSVCDDTQPSLVFFEFDSDTPGSGAADTLRFISSNSAACNWNAFTVVGHTDRAGSNAYNEDLSLRRANAVADMMVRMGINRSQLDISAQGETNPRVPTADGIRSPENRRVEITIVQ